MTVRQLQDLRFKPISEIIKINQLVISSLYILDVICNDIEKFCNAQFKQKIFGTTCILLKYH